MDITQIRYFLKTAELLNYTRAADTLFITRQSLRQSIASMEAELGQPLFLNVRNKLSLTEYGAYLAVSGAKVVEAFEEMQAGFQRLAGNKAVLRIAYSVSLMPFILSDTEGILRAFSARFPHVQLEVARMSNDEAIEAVERGEVDCGCVIQMPCIRKGCTMRKMTEYGVAMDTGTASPRFAQQEITVDALSGIPLIGMGSLQKTMHTVYAECREKGIVLDYRVMPSAIDAFYHIEHGLACGFDIQTPGIPGARWAGKTVLKGHKWELGFLCSEACREVHVLELFCAFMREEYVKRWEERERAWNAMT